MKKYIKIYMDYFDFCAQDIIPCDITGKPAVDVHHIEPRGMGGSKDKDSIENLIALTREEHNKAEAKKYSKEFLKQKHLEYIANFSHYDWI